MTAKNNQGVVVKISGPLVVAEGLPEARLFDVVKIGEKKLAGEIIKLVGNQIFIQVYEETSGLKPGEEVEWMEYPVSVELGPGLLTSIYDGVQRPLAEIERIAQSPFITKGIEAPGLDRQKKWKFKAIKKSGDEVVPGDIIGEVQETELITHKIMVPPRVFGQITDIQSGNYTVTEVIAKIADTEITMLQRWGIREPRPVQNKLLAIEPMLTGQRVIDTFFPIVKGGAACIPGPFGSGKTVVQHQLAKWADVDIVIFIGCGERGNEMTDVLKEFPELLDPKSGRPLMERTVLIANTSNMPVAAREASVYTGITIGEYFRDMGYKVALMADSTSRWAEALREISGRLEEMPGEEGYPAYLGSRTAAFYERAGYVKCLGSDNRQGSLSVIGAVSPPGGDLSEPVTQNTLRVTKVFWGLDSALAYKRHYPAINWLSSYSLYLDNIADYAKKNIAEDWSALRLEAMSLLQQESSLEEIVKLVGLDSLSVKEQLVLETSKSLREDYLQQFAFDEVDTYTSTKKMHLMLSLILTWHHEALEALDRGVKLSVIKDKKELKEGIARAKYVPEKELATLEKLLENVHSEFNKLA
jgi:V/A-type H+-transporting ATPase subunit A